MNNEKPSALPPMADVAARLRMGESKTELAAKYGVSARTVYRRLADAGWNGDGTPKTERIPPRRPASEATLSAGPQLRVPDDAVLPCRADPDAWFPEPGWHPQLVADIKALCGGCPIRVECAEFAIAHPDIVHGIWGGLTRSDLRRIRGRRAGKPVVEDTGHIRRWAHANGYMTAGSGPLPSEIIDAYHDAQGAA